MTRFVLAGGTDVAEMVLFSADNLPSGGFDDESLSRLVSESRAIRMPTGADGAYLLHIYVDDDIPEAIKRYCVIDDALESEIHIESGQIAFGGAESTYAEFESNPNIREDVKIPQGIYAATAYHTDYPDEMIEDAVVEVIGKDGIKATSAPTYIVLGTAVVTMLLAIVGFAGSSIALGGAAAVIVGGILWFKSYTGSDKFKRLTARKLAVEREYPSIVVRLVRQRD